MPKYVCSADVDLFAQHLADTVGEFIAIFIEILQHCEGNARQNDSGDRRHRDYDKKDANDASK